MPTPDDAIRTSAEVRLHCYADTIGVWIIPRRVDGRPQARHARSLIIDAPGASAMDLQTALLVVARQLLTTFAE